MKQNEGIIRVLVIIVLGVLVVGGAYLYSAGTFKSVTNEEEATSTDTNVVTTINSKYRNEEFGFYFETLPKGWTSYYVVQGEWEGRLQDSTSSEPDERGPKITLKDSRVSTSTAESWQSIPVLVYTIEQWNKDLIVSAAPIGPSELGRNNKYVFALPPRAIGFAETLGVTEVMEWMQDKPLKTFNIQ